MTPAQCPEQRINRETGHHVRFDVNFQDCHIVDKSQMMSLLGDSIKFVFFWNLYSHPSGQALRNKKDIVNLNKAIWRQGRYWPNLQEAVFFLGERPFFAVAPASAVVWSEGRTRCTSGCWGRVRPLRRWSPLGLGPPHWHPLLQSHSPFSLASPGLSREGWPAVPFSQSPQVSGPQNALVDLGHNGCHLCTFLSSYLTPDLVRNAKFGKSQFFWSFIFLHPRYRCNINKINMWYHEPKCDTQTM